MPTADDIIADAIRLTRIYGKLIVADRPPDPKEGKAVKIKDVIVMLAEFPAAARETDIGEVVIDGHASQERVRIYSGSDGEPFAMVEPIPSSPETH